MARVSIFLPLDDNYQNLRDGFWLDTDREFKTAPGVDRPQARLPEQRDSSARYPADYSSAEPWSRFRSFPRMADQNLWMGRANRLSATSSHFPKSWHRR